MQILFSCCNVHTPHTLARQRRRGGPISNLCGDAVGAQARLMSHALRKIVANARKCNCLIILVNQLRQKVPLPRAAVLPAAQHSYSPRLELVSAAGRRHVVHVRCSMQF